MMGDANIRAVAFRSTQSGICQYNKDENTGHNCFLVSQGAVNVVVRYNECINWKLRSSDGGALYATGYKEGDSVLFERNLCHDAVGSTHGTTKQRPGWNAIYEDNNSEFVTFKDNTVYNIRYGNAGFFQEGTTNCRAIGNKFIVQDSLAFLMPSYSGNKGGSRETNNGLVGNVFFSYGRDEGPFVSLLRRHASSGLQLERNAYCSPFSEVKKIIGGYGNTDYSLRDWQEKTGQDKNSVCTPTDIKVPVAVFFDVNSTKKDRTITLPAGRWVDPFDREVSGDIVLEPYTSVILLAKKLE
jgi:hypothetical protein